MEFNLINMDLEDYQAFENAEECWEELNKHTPFGWVKSGESNEYIKILNVNDRGVFCLIRNDPFSPLKGLQYRYALYKNFCFLDKTPFGKKKTKD